MCLQKHQHGGNLAKAARLYQVAEQDFIDFSASINPLGPAPGVYQAILDNVWRLCHYPDPDCSELTETLAAHLGVAQENIVFGNGGAELIYALPSIFSLDNALVVAPTFNEYAEALKAAGKKVEYYPLPVQGDVCSALRHLGEMMTEQIVFICNPNNPTGRLYPVKDLQALLEMAERKHSILVVDEAFMDFVPDRSQQSLMPMVAKHRNLVVLYSMTKFFGIPGIRLGALIAHSDVCNVLQERLDPWRVNALAQKAGIAALKDIDHMQKTLQVVEEEKFYLLQSLSAIKGIKPLPGAANFLLLQLSWSKETYQQCIRLLGERGLLVRDCSNFAHLEGNYIRIAIRTRSENDKLLQALREIAGGLP